MKNRKLSPSDPQQHRIPDLDIIDLEAQSPLDDARPGASGGSPEEASGREGGKKRCPAWLNIHTVLLAVAVLFVAGIVYKVMTFGEYVDLDEIFSDGPGEYSDTYDTAPAGRIQQSRVQGLQPGRHDPGLRQRALCG